MSEIQKAMPILMIIADKATTMKIISRAINAEVTSDDLAIACSFNNSRDVLL